MQGNYLEGYVEALRDTREKCRKLMKPARFRAYNDAIWDCVEVVDQLLVKSDEIAIAGGIEEWREEQRNRVVYLG